MDLPTKFNPNKLLKKELVWLFENRCKKHGMPFVEHPKCFYKEKPSTTPLTEKVGFFDIEASNLTATFGYVISWCIKEAGGKIIKDCVRPNEIRNGTFDKRIIKNLCVALRKFDRVVVYWGTDRKFDLPYVRTRAVKWGLDFPEYMELYATDLYTYVKGKLRLHRNSLFIACEFFDIPSKGHKLIPEIWCKAMSGDKKALDFIVKHNEEDVISTEMLYNKLDKYARSNKTSI